MAEKVELVSPFAVPIEGDEYPTWASRDNIQEVWGRMSAEQKAHNLKRGNVTVSEQTPAEEAHAKEQARDRTLDDVTAASDAATGRAARRQRAGGEA